MNLNEKKIIIYTPEFNEKVGGIVVLHNLAKELSNLGYNSMLYSMGGEKYENIFCNKFATAEDVDDNSVVIYPEIIEGNPLGAKNIVRWILCDLGKNCPIDIYRTWGKDDLVFHFSTFNSQNSVADVEILYNVWINPLIKNRNLQRSGSCYLFKKAAKFHEDINLIHPKDSILIDNCSFEEAVDIFNQKQFFYCYDPYSFYDSVAALCGCVPIVVPIDGLSKLDWLKTRAMFHAIKDGRENVAGIAYGMDDIEYAKKTLVDAWREKMDVVDYGRESIKQFVRISSNYFFDGAAIKSDFCTVGNMKTILGWENGLKLHSSSSLNSIIKRNMKIKIENYEKDLINKTDECLKKDQQIMEKEQQFDAVVNSLRWKVPNYFYKLYKKFIKRYIPKKMFLFSNFFIDMYRKVMHGYFCRMIRKYFNLSRLAYDEFAINGWSGLFFALKRHMKKRSGKLLIGYPHVNDYEKNLVSIAILTKDHLDLIQPCIESIEENLSSKYKVEILIGDTGSTDKAVWDFYKSAKKKYGNIKISKFKNYFFCKNYNDLIRNVANGEFIILLNNDTVVKRDWIDNLVDPLTDKRIGVVGGKLLFKDGTIQHAGIEVNEQGHYGHKFHKENGDLPEANFMALVPAVTFACVAVRHDVYNRFGLDESFKEESQDTDFCLRIREAGFGVLYNPKAEIYHFECSTRDWRKGSVDHAAFHEKWKKRTAEISQKLQRIAFDPEECNGTIVIMRDDGIGDLLMGISAFENLRKKYPDKKLILATYERNVEMMDGFGIFDEIIPIPNGKKYSPLPIPTVGTKVYNFIDLEMHFGSSLAKAKDDNKINRHDVFTREMGLKNEYSLVKIPNYTEARKKVENILQEMNVDINQKFVVFNLIASNPARSWWEPYYLKLIEAVEDMGYTPLIIGTKNSQFFKGKRVVNLVGKTSTIAEYIEAVKLGKYVISTDTSAYHVAALAEIPFVAIFTGGVLIESRLGYYEKYEAIEPVGLGCYPCWDEGCHDLSIRHKKEPCRLMVTPEKIIEKFKELVVRYPQ